jgi:predicted outer membrane protein
MKTIKRQLAVALLMAAGIYMGCATPTMAQNQPTKKTHTGAKAGHKSVKDKADASMDKAMDAQANEASTEVVNIADDAEFLRKAYEGGLAEIELGRLAEQKAKSDQVKEYAQKMVEEHTTANQMIASLLADKSSDNTATGSVSGSSATDNNASNNNNAGSVSGVGAGSGTVTGTGSGSAGTGAGGNTGTGGTDTSSVGSTAGSGNGNAGVAGADANRPAGATGNNTSGVGSTSNTDVNTNAGSSNAGLGTDVTAATVKADNAMGSTSAEVKAKESYILSTDLSAEHVELKSKLSKLSGAAFDKQYLRDMVKSHDKMWKMVYAKSKEAEGKDNASLTSAQAWAKKHVDVVRHHKEHAIKIMNSGSSTDDKKSDDK